jgi:hypothetical protein
MGIATHPPQTVHKDGAVGSATCALREAIMESMEQGHTSLLPDNNIFLETSEATRALEDEAFLTVEILQLWDIHLYYQGLIKETDQKARALRHSLGKLLYHMKQVLVKPGRIGGWSSFLKERKIPRATADRLVIRYQESLNRDANRLNEANSAATEEEIQTLFNSMRPKLRRVLRMPQSLYRFIDLLTASYGTYRRVTDDGILILKPQQADSVADSAGEHEAEPKSVLARPMVGLDQELM